MTLLFLALLAACSSPSDEEPIAPPSLEVLREDGERPAVLRIGVTPGQGGATEDRLRSLRAYLERQLDFDLHIEVAASSDDLVTRFDRHDLDVAFMNPVAFATSGNKVPIAAATHGGSPTYLGYLVVRDTRRFPTLSSLRGARVAWVSRSSASGYLYPRALMRYRGIDPAHFFMAETFATDHLSAIRSVVAGEVDAAAVASAFVDPGTLERIPEADLVHVIAKTERIPLDCVVVRDDLSRSVAIALRDALLALERHPEESQAVERSWGMGGFIPPDPLRYDRVAEALAAERALEGS